MADLKFYDVVLKPVVSERSMANMAEKKYTFDVHPKATKVQVKDAIEKLFEGVKVEKVRTMIRKPKVKVKMTKQGKVAGRKSTRKIAIITLTAESKDIEIFSGM